MTEKHWNNIIDGVQAFMIFVLIVTVAICVLSLIGFDVIIGAGVMMYLTNQDLKASVFISLATSGLLMSLMFVGYMLMSKNKKNLGGFVFILSLGVYCLDVYFDSLTADYLRFGEIVSLKSLPSGDVQILFRILIGGISTIGEGLAIAIILGMPVLKTLISDVLSNSIKINSFSVSKRPDNDTKTSKVFKPKNRHLSHYSDGNRAKIPPVLTAETLEALQRNRNG